MMDARQGWKAKDSGASEIACLPGISVDRLLDRNATTSLAL
jgi:hypothetical protein